MSNPANTVAWNTLLGLAQQVRARPRADSVFAGNPGIVDGGGLALDFSRQHVDQPVFAALLDFAKSMQLELQRDALLAGKFINTTENRPVLHTTLRDTIPAPVVTAQLDKMRTYCARFQNGEIVGATGKVITDVVNIGIGGSSLGPEMAYAALVKFAMGPRIHFVSNIDGAHLSDTLAALNPETTLFIVASKTFTTDETLTNAASARKWLESRAGIGPSAIEQFIAVTANKSEALRCGYSEQQIFEFWDWVGGRYSIWSTIGLPLALGLGYENFSALLDGARTMDDHFKHAPMAQNLPMLMGLIGVWNRNFMNLHSLAVLPYSQRLAALPRYLQQLEMESNGKQVDVDGLAVDYATCPVIFGEPGTNSQHSFHQFLHQGTEVVAVDMLLVVKDESDLAGHHQKLLANAIAQADALWQGQSQDVAYAKLQPMAMTEIERKKLAAHKTYPGGRPVTVMLLPKLNAFHLGAVLALYEHKVFVQGVLWNINSFDQWGVELGKSLAQQVLPLIINRQGDSLPHLAPLLKQIDQMQIAP